jgi:hypothetical protein
MGQDLGDGSFAHCCLATRGRVTSMSAKGKAPGSFSRGLQFLDRLLGQGEAELFNLDTDGSNQAKNLRLLA